MTHIIFAIATNFRPETARKIEAHLREQSKGGSPHGVALSAHEYALTQKLVGLHGNVSLSFFTLRE